MQKLSISSLLLLLAVRSSQSIQSQAPDCKNHPLLSPASCCKDKAPPAYNVTWETTVGSIMVHVESKWSPIGAERFYNLCKFDYFGASTEGGNANGFFRVVPGFVVQFGIAGNTSVSAPWENLNIKDDPVVLSNIRGTIAYADAGADTRTTQVYINFANNSRLDAMGFTVFGTLSEEDMLKVDKIYAGYEQTPDQDLIYSQGNKYLEANFPKLDYINKTSVVTAASYFNEPSTSLFDRLSKARTLRKLTPTEVKDAGNDEARLHENAQQSSSLLVERTQPETLFPPFTPSPLVDVINLSGNTVTLPVKGAPLVAFAYNASDSWAQSVWADSSEGLTTRSLFLQDSIFDVPKENATVYLFMSFDEQNAATDAGMMHDLLVSAMTSLEWNSSFQSDWLSRAVFSKEPVSKLGANSWVSSLLSNWTNSDVLPPPSGPSGRAFTVSSTGILLEAGWFEGRPTMQTLSWAAQWLDFEMRTQANLTASNEGGAIVVNVLNHSLMQGFPGAQNIVEIPASSTGTAFNHLEVEMSLGCPTPWDNSCAIWDRQAQVLVCCTGNIFDPTCGGVNQELARWITPFRRGLGHWLTDVTPLLPLLVGDQTTSASTQCSFTMATDAWAMPWFPSLSLRFSSLPDAAKPPMKVAPLWNTGAGGNGGSNWGCIFDQKYNDGTCFPNKTVAIPPGATRAILHSVITGHGSDNNNCAEFCVTTHVMNINGHTYSETFSNAGTDIGCTLETLNGALPSEHGTWPYGRDGWCDGSAVRPWILDISNDIDFSSDSFEVSYRGLFNGQDPNPQPQTNMPYMIVHVFVSFS